MADQVIYSPSTHNLATKITRHRYSPQISVLADLVKVTQPITTRDVGSVEPNKVNNTDLSPR